MQICPHRPPRAAGANQQPAATATPAASLARAGTCEDGEGAKSIEEGTFDFGGKIPVNPSGGRLSANAVQVAGLSEIAECVLQLRGDAGERQVEGAKHALAHGINGMCGQAHCVWILGN